MNQDLIRAIKQGDQQAFDQLYKQLRPEFTGWARKNFQLEEQDSIELFQQSMLKLYESIIQDKLENIQVNLRTYFYGIAKNIQLNVIRAQKVRLKHQDSVAQHLEILASLEADDQLVDLRKKTREAFAKLKEACQQILRLFYYEQKKGQEIAEILQLKSPQVVRTQKSRCLNYLRELINNK